MNTFERAVGGMADTPCWFVWRLEWDAKQGKFLKTPCAHNGSAAPINGGDPANWSSFDAVAAAVARLDIAGSATRYAMGFWITRTAGVFFLDVDRCVTDGQLHPFAKGLVDAFPGAMVERSSSGKGLHIIGSGPVPSNHRNKPERSVKDALAPLEIELYSQDRGIAFGLEGVAQGCADVQFDVGPLCAAYFPPRPEHETGDGPRPEWRGPADDDVLIQRMLSARPSAAAAFGGKASLPQLWRGEAEHNSENDMALACHLAFWAGCDVERVTRLMWASGMVRAKWRDHRTYVGMTAENACNACTNVYQEPQRSEPVPPVTPIGPGTIRNASDLLRQEFKAVQWAIRDILPEGVTILSGDPKIGKSWFVYQACVAVATGSPMWPGRDAETQGDTLMLALEDNDRRLRRRLDTLLHAFPGKSPNRLHYVTEWPRAEAGVAAIAEFLRDHPECRMVVIDTISAFRDSDPGRLSAYQHDYKVGEMLKPLAREFNCAVVLVMHNRKQAAGDVMHKVSGTQGMTGSVDNVLVLERGRGESDAVLHVDGRDIEEQQEMALRLNGGVWTYLGNAEDVRRSKERNAVLEALSTTQGYGTAKEIHEAIGGTVTLGAVKTRLSRMHKAGELEKAGTIYTVVGLADRFTPVLPPLPGPVTP